MREIERYVILQIVDTRWREHLESMDYLREGVHLRAMAQKDPLVEYRGEGHVDVRGARRVIREEVVLTLFHVEVQREEAERQLQPVAGAAAPRATSTRASHGADAIAAAGGGAATALAEQPRDADGRPAARSSTSTATSAATTRAGAGSARSSSAATAPRRGDRAIALPPGDSPAPPALEVAAAHASHRVSAAGAVRLRPRRAATPPDAAHGARAWPRSAGSPTGREVRGVWLQPEHLLRSAQRRWPSSGYDRARWPTPTTTSLADQLEELGAQLAWVREYL